MHRKSVETQTTTCSYQDVAIQCTLLIDEKSHGEASGIDDDDADIIESDSDASLDQGLMSDDSLYHEE